MNDELRNRRSVRLKSFDYRSPAAYFITICGHEKECIFGEVVGGVMVTSRLGEVVEEEWLKTAQLRPYIMLDAAVVMPNHFHGIVMFTDVDEGTARRAPTTRSFGHAQECSLASVVGAFKSAVSRRINELRGTPGAAAWQRNYYEHVIRDERDLQQVREYVVNNPAQWELDRENPFK